MSDAETLRRKTSDVAQTLHPARQIAAGLKAAGDEVGTFFA
jgi:hypothetical protein